MAQSKITGIALTLTLLLGLLNLIPSPAAATPDEVKWSRVNIPAEGEPGNWLLASGSDVQHLTMTADGTLYAYANPTGTSYTLFKSTDAGHSWAATGKVTDAIVDIATAPGDASVIYYATTANVYKSADAGKSFSLLPLNPGGAGSNNVQITAIDVTRVDNNNTIAVATRDTDAAQYGGIYLLDENKPFSGWLSTNLGNYDAYAIAFSPNFPADHQLVAVVTDEVDTSVTTRISDKNWGTTIGNARITALVPISATIAFPDDYDAPIEDYALFVGLATGSNNGDVYMVNGMRAPGSSAATDLNIGAIYNLSNIDVTGLAVSGNTTRASLLAGSASSTQVYISKDSGTSWTRSRQKPTGQSKTWLLMAPDFITNRRAYAATSGTESAFSYTMDGGVTWKQTSLIDTKISPNGIIDLAVSPNYSQDSTLFMLTFDAEHIEHSLWRSLNDGTKWERILTSTLASASSLNMVGLSLQYGSGSQLVFLSGNSGSTPFIWQSTDKGQTFTRLSAPLPVDIWTVVNDNTLFLGIYDGSNGLVYRTNNGGLSYSTNTTVGNQPLQSIAISPGYGQDRTLLVGNTNGWVYWSKDDGSSFERLGQQLPPSPATPGNITVAFDPRFSSNKTVYAASAVQTTTASKERIYRFIIGKSNTWESVDSTLPIGSMLSQLMVSDNETLYTTNSQPVDTVNKKGGLERSLNPIYPLGPTFETVTRGLDDGATLSGLWLRSNQLWSIDTQNTRVMTYNDSLARPVALTSPLNEAQGTGTGNIILNWETLKGATKYKWQLSYDTNFSAVPAQFEGETTGSSARLPALETATIYHWRVRATEPVLSPWSDKRSFTTSLGTIGTAVTAPELYSPEAGARGVALKPIFQWSAIAGAESYELLVSTDASFSNPTILKIGNYALPATAWQSTTGLDYGTTYYWKVRASGSNSSSAWSAVGAFTTESTAAPPSPPSEPPSPAPLLQPSAPPPPPPPAQLPAQPIFPEWTIFMVAALLFTIVILLITLLLLVAGMRRS
ncbi:MAG: hypothetical protein HYY41_04135 [Chloroflexi bacterium]|nr:hypothetical protein [Chloroflexota bacterium]